MNVTPEMIKALALLRDCAYMDTEEVQKAVNVLDNAGVFAAVDEATGYDVNPEPEQSPNGLDPAEWGDMAFGPRPSPLRPGDAPVRMSRQDAVYPAYTHTLPDEPDQDTMTTR